MKILGILLSIIIWTIFCIPYVIVFMIIQDVKFEPFSFIVSIQCQVTGFYYAIKFNKWFQSRIKPL